MNNLESILATLSSNPKTAIVVKNNNIEKKVKSINREFPGGPVVRMLSLSRTGSIPGQRTKTPQPQKDTLPKNHINSYVLT